jgi:hypothetical protein
MADKKWWVLLQKMPRPAAAAVLQAVGTGWLAVMQCHRLVLAAIYVLQPLQYVGAAIF